MQRLHSRRRARAMATYVDTSAGYKNFSEFVEKTLDEELVAAKKEFTAVLAEIDK